MTARTTKDLEGRVALVTGAGRGIGRATAMLLAERGASVVVNDLDDDPAEEAARVIETAGGRATPAVGNVAKRGDCEALVGTAIEAFGDLHILVNNAGLTRDSTLHRMEADEWDLVQDVVLRGAFHMLQAASDVYRQEPDDDEPHRKVVNVSSISGLDGNTGQANYASAKAGLLGLTRTMAREWARYRVCVNAVAPGWIDTRLTQPKDDDTGLGLPEGKRDMLLQFLPWGPGDTDDVAEAIGYLSSPASDYVTGEVLRVSGPPMGSGMM